MLPSGTPGHFPAVKQDSPWAIWGVGPPCRQRVTSQQCFSLLLLLINNPNVCTVFGSLTRCQCSEGTTSPDSPCPPLPWLPHAAHSPWPHSRHPLSPPPFSQSRHLSLLSESWFFWRLSAINLRKQSGNVNCCNLHNLKKAIWKKDQTHTLFSHYFWLHKCWNLARKFCTQYQTLSTP